MGRYYWSKRDTVEGSQNFNIKFLKDHKYLDGISRYGTVNWSRNGEPTGSIGIKVLFSEYPHLNLDYSITSNSTGEKRFVNYDVPLVSTPCNFGGKRWWFVCWECAEKTYTIYMSGHDKFLCRKCCNLAYESQNKNRRGLWHQVGKVLDTDKLEGLPQFQGKYRYYRGRSTRNFRRLLKAEQRANHSAYFLKQIGWM